ncbi:uncharacterized protein GGS25DRAFT_15429 [Hypoxylon fragiforme]|uniref:uncharacterized protein n=1 Tax=Hypoxylon fragiforme TaxID=63214 RepID=UPI0020C6B76C|nr:uncharacterized protein GGS25DRAFT_15429 [Hypoxylon fragiforme]KAI2613771.1 hypothetical protein GGS25DRAFT_15429 [Hypoxylon fragiforme]
MTIPQPRISNTRRHAAVSLLACSTTILLLLLWDRRILPSPDRGTPLSFTPPLSSSGVPAAAEPLHYQQQQEQQQLLHQPTSPNSIDLSTPHAPFIPHPLSHLCAELTSPLPHLTFLCDNNSGGPGNIRNYILTCIRYALASGARSLVVPRIRTRSPSDPANLFAEHQGLDYMFDAAHFREALGTACPGMRVYARVEDVPGVVSRARERSGGSIERTIERITPKHFGGSRTGCDARDPNRHTDRFGAAFRSWLHASAAERGWADNTPRLIRLSWGVLWDWPVYRDGPELAATFGGLLKIRPDILELADAVVASMRNLAASTPANEAVAGQAFLGVHLRTEADALSAWPSYENQTKAYLREAASQGYEGRVAYLASGSSAETERFQKDAMAALQLDVRSKHGLLAGDAERLGRLEALSWDQQALVDFAVLLSCDYFVGVSPSSFSINVALKRHLRQEGLYTRPWKVGGRGDGRSWLVGRYDRYWDDWLFMFDGMWA